MNSKMAKRARRVARQIATNVQMQGNLVQEQYVEMPGTHRQKKFVKFGGEEWKYGTCTFMLHPSCYKGIYRRVKENVRKTTLA